MNWSSATHPQDHKARWAIITFFLLFLNNNKLLNPKTISLNFPFLSAATHLFLSFSLWAWSLSLFLSLSLSVSLFLSFSRPLLFTDMVMLSEMVVVICGDVRLQSAAHWWLRKMTNDWRGKMDERQRRQWLLPHSMILPPSFRSFFFSFFMTRSSLIKLARSPIFMQNPQVTPVHSSSITWPVFRVARTS